MPDPLLYLAASGAAAFTAALLMGLSGWRLWRDTQEARAESSLARVAVTLGLAGGLVAGFWVLDLYVACPPVNALDRLLTIVLPLAVATELVASLRNVPRWFAWAVRMLLVAGTGRILLHGSVYLSISHSGWETSAALIVSALATAALWLLLVLLAARSPPGISVPCALALSLIASGLAILLSGYVSGGAAVLPLSAAIVAVVALGAVQAPATSVQASLGVGVMGLSGILFIGRFFGGLSTASAMTLLLAPLGCWITELSILKRRPAWLVAAVRLSTVAIPLCVVIVIAKIDFDRKSNHRAFATAWERRLPREERIAETAGQRRPARPLPNLAQSGIMTRDRR